MTHLHVQRAGSAPSEAKSRDLVLPVKRIYFDAILDGSKRFEYRLDNDHWRKRLEGRRYDRIVMTLGYPTAADHAKRLVLPWSGYEKQTLTHPHFGDAPVEVFAIFVDVRQRLEASRTA